MSFTCKVSADLFARAWSCVSKEQTRYYLGGVFVHPHATRGVLMVSTDGRRLICVYDPEGTCEGSGIVKADAVALKVAKGTGAEYITVEADRLQVFGFDETRALYIQAGAALVDGSFPDWRRVMPSMPKDPVTPGAIDMKLLAGLADAMATDRTSPVRLYASDDSSPILVIGDHPGCVGVVMPIRAALGGVPAWL